MSPSRARSPATWPVIDVPSLVDGPGHRGGHLVGLGRPQVVGLRSLRMLISCRAPHTGGPDPGRGAGGLPGRCSQAGTAPADRCRRVRHQGGEGGVDPLDDRTAGPEVGRQLHRPAALGTEAARRRPGRWRCRPGGSGRSTAWGRRRRRDDRAPRPPRPRVRPASLTRRVGGGDPDGQLDLDGIGVLELVEKRRW